jgi:hypothetical protein
LRYVLLVNVVAALIPTMSVKGRANDPLLHSTWWKVDQHSAVLVVVLAAIVGSALVFLATRRNIRTWWILVGCGIVSNNAALGNGNRWRNSQSEIRQFREFIFANRAFLAKVDGDPPGVSVHHEYV